LSQTAQITFLRGSMVLIAAFIFCWGLVYDPQESVLSYIYLTGAIFTAAGIITLVGLYWKRANSWGAYLTVAICITLPVADLVGKKLVGAAYPLSAEQSGLAALLLSVAAFFVTGVVSRRGEERWVSYAALAKAEDAAAVGRRGQEPV
jgi:Na+/proline symporter